MVHHDNMRPYMHLFWAKAQPYGQPGPERIHLLEHHLADVGACFEALMRIPTIRKRLAASGGIHHPDDLHESVVARLSVFAALHDVGKVNVGFQARVWRNEDLGGKPKPRWAGHDADMVPVLMDEDHETAGWFFAALGWWDDAISSWDERSGETVCALFVAALSHHGRPLKLEGGRSRNPAIWRPFADLNPAKYVKRLGRLAQSWFPAAFVSDAPPLPSTPAFQHMFLGLCNWADWIGSDERRFSYCCQPREDYIDTARNRAKKAVEAMGLDLSAQRNSFEGVPEFATLFGIDGSPNAIQQAVRQTPLDRRLVIIESETGSGKTEAALWRFARMYKAGLVDGIYFALPTRSAAVQIYQRVKRFTAKLFPRCTPPTVLAVPGYQPSTVATPIEIPPYDDRSAGSRPDLIPWASEHPKRYLAAQVAVGTIDQAMMGALRVKNAHMRFACLSRNLLVVDEVHASDTYMNIVLEALLDAHLGAGGYALLMSATLGSVARHRWLDHGKRAAGRSLPTLADAVSQPYPAVSYTYTATDDDNDTASLRFTIRVNAQSPRPPPAPVGLEASVVPDSCDSEHCDVAFSWPSKSGYSRYKIYYSHHRSGTNAPRHFDGQWIGTVSGSATSFTKTNLDCGYTYQYRSKAEGDGVTYTTTWSTYGNAANVSAVCGDDDDDDDDGGCVRAPNCAIIISTSRAPAPTGVETSEHTDTTIKVSWEYDDPSVAADVVEYEVVISCDCWTETVTLRDDESSVVVGGLEPETEYSFQVRARGDGSPYARDFGNLSNSVSGTTEPAFNVITIAIDHFNNDDRYRITAETPDWNVLEVFDLDILIYRKGGAGTMPDGYHFRLVVDPASTGLQFSPTGECDWSAPSALQDERKQTNWYATSSTETSTSFIAKMVRCDIGQEPDSEMPNSGLKVEVGKGPWWSVGNVRPVKSIINMEQAWHKDDPTFSYWIRGMTTSLDHDDSIVIESIAAVPGLFPAAHPDVVPTSLTDKFSYLNSAHAWNGIQGSRVRLVPGANETTAGIIFAGFGDGDDDPCEGAIMCYTGADGEEYPHKADGAKIWIKNPPYVGSQRPSATDQKIWTANCLDFSGNTNRREYLLTGIVHELGHGIGLEHSANFNEMMYGDYVAPDQRREIPPVGANCGTAAADQCGLGENDKRAAEALYPIQ